VAKFTLYLKPIHCIGFFVFIAIFIIKLNIMAKAKKRPAAKPNRGNVVKRNNLLKQNEEILSRLKNV
jgi:hypothetical protein